MLSLPLYFHLQRNYLKRFHLQLYSSILLFQLFLHYFVLFLQHVHNLDRFWLSEQSYFCFSLFSLRLYSQFLKHGYLSVPLENRVPSPTHRYWSKLAKARNTTTTRSTIPVK